MRDSVPQRCPDCGCDLRALPPPGRCPECGFEYDEHTRVWRSRQPWQRHALVYFVIGTAIGVVLAILYRLVVGHVPYPVFPLLFGLVYAAGGLLIRRVLTGRLSGRFVALTPKGILVGTRRRSSLIPWDDVDRVSQPRGVPKVQRRGSGVPVVLEDVFEKPQAVAAFREEVKAAEKRYAKSAASLPPDDPPPHGQFG
jgi:hypothetical protein